MQSFIMNSHEVFIHIHQGCFAGTGAIVRLPQCQWSKPDGYGKISQCITTIKHSKAKTVCIFLGIYCTYHHIKSYLNKKHKKFVKTTAAKVSFGKAILHLTHILNHPYGCNFVFNVGVNVGSDFTLDIVLLSSLLFWTVLFKMNKVGSVVTWLFQWYYML